MIVIVVAIVAISIFQSAVGFKLYVTYFIISIIIKMTYFFSWYLCIYIRHRKVIPFCIYLKFAFNSYCEYCLCTKWHSIILHCFRAQQFHTTKNYIEVDNWIFVRFSFKYWPRKDKNCLLSWNHVCGLYHL